MQVLEPHLELKFELVIQNRRCIAFKFKPSEFSLFFLNRKFKNPKVRISKTSKRQIGRNRVELCICHVSFSLQLIEGNTITSKPDISRWRIAAIPTFKREIAMVELRKSLGV